MTISGTKSVILRIHGRVQGVWFRAWTQENATRRGVRGWVRNREDGTVETLLCGPLAAVDEMIDACHRGPKSARVERIEQAPAEPVDQPGFHLRPTA